MVLDGFQSIGLLEIGAAASAGMLLLALYKNKASNLETIRDREDRLRNLEGKSVKEGQFMITVDNVEVDEKSGFVYRFKRWLLRPAEGTIYVTVRLHEIGVTEEFWESDHTEALYDTLNFPVECVNSQMTSSHTALVFQLQTSKYEDLKQFLDQLTNFFWVMEDSGAASVASTRPGGLPF